MYNMDVVLKDNKGRTLMWVKDKHIACARYPDLEEEDKQCMLDVYLNITNENPNELRRFLDFEPGVNEFCG